LNQSAGGPVATAPGSDLSPLPLKFPELFFELPLQPGFFTAFHKLPTTAGNKLQ
jgi:hypothetical protein